MLFDHLEAAQIVVDRNAGIIYKNVEGIYFGGRLVNLRGARHIQSYRRHAFVRMSDCFARTRIYPLRAALECLFDKSSTNASVGASDQTVLFAIAMLFLLSYFDFSFRRLWCRRWLVTARLVSGIERRE